MNNSFFTDNDITPEEINSTYKGDVDKFLADNEITRDDIKRTYGLDIDSALKSRRVAPKPAAPSAPAPRAGFDSWQGLAQSGKEFVGKVKDVFAHEADRTTALAEGARTKAYQAWEKDWKDWNARKAQARLRRTEFKEPQPQMDGEKYVRNHGFGGFSGAIDDAAAAFRVPTKIATDAIQAIPGVGSAVRAGRGYLAPKAAYQAAVDEQGAKGGEPDLYELGLRAQEIADANAKQASLDDLADPTSRGVVQASKDMWTGIKEDPHSLAYDLTDPGTAALGMGVGALGKTATAAVDASKAGQAAKLIAQSRKGLMSKATGAVKDLGTKVGMQKAGINVGEFATDVVTGSAAGGDELSSDNLIGQLPVALGMMGTSKVGDVTFRGTKALAKRALKGKGASAGVGASGTESTGITIDMTPPKTTTPDGATELGAPRQTTRGVTITNALDSSIDARTSESGPLTHTEIAEIAGTEAKRRIDEGGDVNKVAEATKKWVESRIPDDATQIEAKKIIDEMTGNTKQVPVAVVGEDGTTKYSTETKTVTEATQKPEAGPTKKQELSDKRAELEAHYDEVRTSGLTDDELLANLVEHAKSVGIPAKKIIAEITTANPEVSSKFNGNPNLKNRARVMAGDPPLVLKDGRNVGGTIEDFQNEAPKPEKVKNTEDQNSNGYNAAKLLYADIIPANADIIAARKIAEPYFDTPFFYGQGEKALNSYMSGRAGAAKSSAKTSTNVATNDAANLARHAFVSDMESRYKGMTPDEIRKAGLEAEANGVKGAFEKSKTYAKRVENANKVAGDNATREESAQANAQRQQETARAKLEERVRGTFDSKSGMFVHPATNGIRSRHAKLLEPQILDIVNRYNKLKDKGEAMGHDFPELRYEADGHWHDRISSEMLAENDRIKGEASDLATAETAMKERVRLFTADTELAFQKSMEGMAKAGYFDDDKSVLIPLAVEKYYGSKSWNAKFDEVIASITSEVNGKGSSVKIPTKTDLRNQKIKSAIAKFNETLKNKPQADGAKLLTSPQLIGAAAITSAVAAIAPEYIGQAMLGSAALGLALRNMSMPKAFEMVRNIRDIFRKNHISFDAFLKNGNRMLAEAKNIRTAQSALLAAVVRAKDLASEAHIELGKDLHRRLTQLSGIRYRRTGALLQHMENAYGEYFKSTGATNAVKYDRTLKMAEKEIFHAMSGRLDKVPERFREAAIRAANAIKAKVTDVIHSASNKIKETPYLNDWAPYAYNEKVMKKLRAEADALGWSKMNFTAPAVGGSLAHEALHNLQHSIDKYLKWDGVEYIAEDGAPPLIQEGVQILNDDIVPESDLGKYLIGNKLPSFEEASKESGPATIKNGERHDAHLENQRRIPYLGDSFYNQNHRAALDNYVRNATAANVNGAYMPNEWVDDFITQMAQPTEDGKFLYGDEQTTREKLGIAQDGTVNRDAGVAGLVTRWANGRLAIGQGAVFHALETLQKPVREVLLRTNTTSADNAVFDSGNNMLFRNPQSFAKGLRHIPGMIWDNALGQYISPSKSKARASANKIKGIGADVAHHTKSLPGRILDQFRVFDKASAMTDEHAILVGLDELKSALDRGDDLSLYYTPNQIQTLKEHWDTNHEAIDDLKMGYALQTKAATSGFTDAGNTPEIFMNHPSFRSFGGLFKNIPWAQQQGRNVEVMLGKDGQVSADRATKFMANLARGVSASAYRAAGYGGKLALITATLAAIGKYPALLAMVGLNKAWRNMDDNDTNDEELYRDSEGDAMADKRIIELETAMKNDPLSTAAGLYAGSIVLPVNINGQFPYKKSNEILEGISGKRSYSTTAADFIAAQSGGLLPTAKFGMDAIEYGKNAIANPTRNNILGGAAYVGAKNIPALRKAFGQDFITQRKPGKSEMAKGESKEKDASRMTKEEVMSAAKANAANKRNEAIQKYMRN